MFHFNLQKTYGPQTSQGGDLLLAPLQSHNSLIKWLTVADNICNIFSIGLIRHK